MISWQALLSAKRKRDLAIYNSRLNVNSAESKNADAEYRKQLDEYVNSYGYDLDLLRSNMSSVNRGLVIDIAALLPVDDLKALLPELVYQVSVEHRDVFAIRKLILKLPKEWVSANILFHVYAVLEAGGDEEYRRLLELSILLEDNTMFDAIINRLYDSGLPDASEVLDDFKTYFNNN